MKKIILFLSAAIICVGVAIGLNADKSTGGRNESFIEQNSSVNSSATKNSNKVDDNKDNKKLEKENKTNSNKENDKKEVTNNDSKKDDNSKLDKESITTENKKEDKNIINENSSTDKKPSSEQKPSENKKPENISNNDKKETVTISINAKTAINYGINKKDGFTHLPSNGVILAPQKVEFKELIQGHFL